MKKYNPQEIEKKWLKVWEERPLYRAEEPLAGAKKEMGKKFYALVEFPYPSGQGLHMGHAFTNTLLDVLARKKRREGFNVLYPMGWDAFGLPTENYAIKTGVHPALVTKKNTDRFRQQMKRLGLAYNWEREVNTTDSDYYRWTQWIFLQFFKHGLAYKKEMPVGWCPSCKIILANEEIVGGKCERCGTVAERKQQEQWLLRITAYADRLADELDLVDYPDYVKAAQRNWIGRTQGVEIDYPVVDLTGVAPVKKISCYSTRPDTNFGATFVVMAPEHPLVEKLTTKDNLRDVKQYIERAKKKSELERVDLEKEKTGVFTGSYCLNRLTGKKMPIWVADFVVLTAGTGIVVGVPAHDRRDWQFAKKYKLSIKVVVASSAKDTSDGGRLKRSGSHDSSEVEGIKEANCFTDYGVLVDSGEYTGLTSQEAIKKITADLVKKGWGRQAVNYHLRDWIFSRQHYWGEPIPMVYCPKCAKKGISWWETEEGKAFKAKDTSDDGVANSSTPEVESSDTSGVFLGDAVDSQGLAGWFPLPESDLPLELPKVERYQPTDTGESPLASIKGWVETTCPHCGGEARRETDTMPNWAGSSWYFLAYAFSHKMKPATIASDSSVILRLSEVEAEGSPAHKGKQGDSSGPLAHQNDGETNVFKRYKDLLDYWLPVDLYLGGAEHTTLHLLYSRFWHKFLNDIGAAPGKEPYAVRRQHGVILGEDGFKMSKSRGNIINPEEIVKKYGADTLRVYLLFMGPYEATMPWNTKGVEGAYRFLKRVWNLVREAIRHPERSEGFPTNKGGDSSVALRIGGFPQNDDATKEEFYWIHKTIKKVTEDIESLSFNTAIAALMEYVNAISKLKVQNLKLSRQAVETLVLLLAPFAPFMSEELWFLLRHSERSEESQLVKGGDSLSSFDKPSARAQAEGLRTPQNDGESAEAPRDTSDGARMHSSEVEELARESAAWSVHQQPWPQYDPKLIKEEKTTIVIQINGKTRDKIEIDSVGARFASPADKEQVKSRALASEAVKRHLEGREVKKIVFVPGRLVNLVVE